MSKKPYPNFDLGHFHRPILTSSHEAQLWFDRGLMWCYAFNQEEGLECFQECLRHDPECPMASWGIAYAAGPFYNFTWRDFTDREKEECTQLCRQHIQNAQDRIGHAYPQDAALIYAIDTRFPTNCPISQEEFDRLDDEYAKAMRKAYLQFPDDLDISAMYVESMMIRTPWKLWNVKTGMPYEGADTLECLRIVEHAIRDCRKKGIKPHPAILHMHIHLLEMSNEPERAMESADALFMLCPEAGHLNHMPSHIYTLCGQYDKAKQVSMTAINNDRKYLEYMGPYNFYTTSRSHDLHMMMYSCMMLGQFKPALNATREMCEGLTPCVISDPNRPQMGITMEGYYSMAMHILVRFGKWEKILNTPLPQPPDLYCVSIAMHHYARTVAYATLELFDEAMIEREKFFAARDRIPAERHFFNNDAQDILGIAEKMMEGELIYHQGRYDRAFHELTVAVERDDNLEYSEPSSWMHPPRHALGALLIEQGYYRDAEKVYRVDLGLTKGLYRCAQHPNNIWSLHGLSECLKQQENWDEWKIINEKLRNAQELSDTKILSSCYCRKNTLLE
ncbi:MAG: hypothetical protein OXF60_00720 [Gammaproteobacteria bacterium]|nr:hypothetical protein [Gammaproteobacteria bacterium]MCY4218718.1 hypothetical protein [Gammaproteobacteria bacterium]